MTTSLYHVQLNVSRPSIAFYKGLLCHLGYTLMGEQDDMFGATNGSTDLWIVQTDPRYAARGFHRKAAGVNHVAFRVDSRAAVDRFISDFLDPRAIPALYGGPREYPEYRPGYYAVFFEDPDRLKLELAYIPADYGSGHRAPRLRRGAAEHLGGPGGPFKAPIKSIAEVGR